MRTFLKPRRLKARSRSKPIQQAAKWQEFDRTLAEVRSKFADLSPEAFEALIEEAVAAARRRGASFGG